MGLTGMIEKIKRQGSLWEIAYKIAIIGLLTYSALALSWIDRGIELTRRDVSDIQSDVSRIQSDLSDIQFELSNIQSDVSDIETNTSR